MSFYIKLLKWKKQMNRQEKSWILYDVANSAFVLVMITAVMPIFFKEFASAGLKPERSTALWGYSNSLAALIIGLAAPYLGTVADSRGFKKKFFTIFLITGIILTLLLTGVEKNNWFTCLLIFAGARICWAGANIFYDSFLVDICEENRRDKISSFGFAFGYIGSVIPFLAVIGILLGGGDRINEGNGIYYKAGFIITALWWAAFSIPALKNLHEREYSGRTEKTGTFRKFMKELGAVRKNRKVLLFLGAYFLYIDGVDTIISMAGAYGLDSGLDKVTLISAILAIQILAFPFAILFGKLSEYFKTKNVIISGIGVYLIISVLAFFLPEFESPAEKRTVFWIISVLVATSMGGIQALSRSYYSKIIPPEKSSEYFGIYNIFGKFAAIMGPFLMALTIEITGHSRNGVIPIIGLFLCGAILLNISDREK